MATTATTPPPTATIAPSSAQSLDATAASGTVPLNADQSVFPAVSVYNALGGDEAFVQLGDEAALDDYLFSLLPGERITFAANGAEDIAAICGSGDTATLRIVQCTGAL